MNVELTIKEGWMETTIAMVGDKGHIEKIIEAIENAFKNDSFVKIE